MTAPGPQTDAAARKMRGKRRPGWGVAHTLALFFAAIGTQENTKRQLVKALLLVLLPCLIGVGWLINRNILAEADSARWETHTRVVKQDLRELFSSLQDAEAGQRGFIITGEKSFLEPYHASLDKSSARLADLRRLTADNPDQQRRLATLVPLVEQKYADLKMAIELREEKGLLAASEVVLIMSGKKIMDSIRTLVSQAQDEEAQLLQERSAAQAMHIRYTTQSVFLGGTLGVLALLMLLIYLRWALAGHREAETAQHASEDQYRSLFNSIDEGFCIIEMVFDANEKPIDYRFLEVNPAFERQTGLSAATGKRMRELVPDHEDQWFEIYGKVALTGESHRFVNEAKAMARCFDVYAFRLDGLKSARVAVLFTDITERRQVKAEILRLNAELEDRVRRRTAQLQAANQELEAFSYSVSHDLRSPLKTIDGFTHLLARTIGETGGKKCTHYLGRIKAGVQQMDDLIDGLLSLAQLSRDTLHFGMVDLAAIARRAEQALREREPDRQVRMRIHDGKPVYGDARLLSVVIHNLLGNAWKFTARQDLASIEMGSQVDATNETVYFVRDNGAGFDMAHADKLFGTFERLHSVSDFSGTGIGLATVKRVIDRHGGRVWAESKENEGATFYFTLPREVESGAAAEQGQKALSGNTIAHELLLN